MSHTPTPWVVIPAFSPTCGDVGITAKGLPNVLAECFEDIRHGSEKARDEAQSNAAFIVKAVNAYDDLVAALKYCLVEHGGYTIRGECERKAKAALVKAGAL